MRVKPDMYGYTKTRNHRENIQKKNFRKTPQNNNLLKTKRNQEI